MSEVDPFKTKERIEALVPAVIKFFLKTVADAHGLSLSSLASMILIKGAIDIKEGRFIIDQSIIDKVKQYFMIDAEVFKEYIRMRSRWEE